MNTFQCPECGHSNVFGSKTCESCLLVFEKHNKKTAGLTQAVQGGSRLEKLWQDVMGQYEDILKHEIFLKAALAEKNLTFASQQYRKIIESLPHDAMALKMRDKIIQMATVTFSMPTRTRTPPKSRAFRNLFLVFITAIVMFVLFSIMNFKK